MRNTIGPSLGRPTRRGRLASLFALIPLAMSAGIAGCLSPGAAGPVISSQRDALDRLRADHTADLAALRGVVESLLAVRRERLLLSVEREIAAGLLTPAGAADLQALDADLASAAPATVIGAEVRAGRLGLEEARALLRDYAGAEGLSDAAAYRRRLLGRLGPLRAHDSASGDLLAALDRRAAAASTLHLDAAASSDSLRAFAASGPALGPAAREAAEQAWRAGVISGIPDERRRAAAQRLLDTAIDLANHASTTEGSR